MGSLTKERLIYSMNLILIGGLTRINQQLAEWAKRQRNLFSKGSLDLDKVAKLNSLGFQWYVSDENWNAMCDRLETYKRKHGSVLVPTHFTVDPPLGNWVVVQRNTYSRYLGSFDTINDTSLQSTAEKLATKKIPAQVHQKRLIRLCSLDFVWSFHDAQWLENYENLVQFKEQNNSSLVPYKYTDQQLVIWIETQRYCERLSEKRRFLLDAIGFVWDPFEERWQDMFDRLCAYKDEGGCIVPARLQNDRELFNWVCSQRKAYRWRMISEEKIAKLESIGFYWTMREIPEP